MRGLISFLAGAVWLFHGVAFCGFDQILFTRHGGTLDSTDRQDYIYSGGPVVFGSVPVDVPIEVPDMYVINDVDVLLYITHTWDSDVIASLIAPDGREVLLFEAVGGADDNFINTCLNDDASISILAGTAPFTGEYQPMEQLGEFNGESGTGIWTLHLDDNYPWIDDGTLQGWTLTLGGRIDGYIEGFVTAEEDNQPVEGVIVRADGTNAVDTTDAGGMFGLRVNVGTYDVIAELEGWCEGIVEDVEATLHDTVDADFALQRPVYISSHSSINVFAPIGEIKTDTVAIGNEGNCDLEFEIETTASWLSVQPYAGQIEPGASTDIIVTVDAVNLPIGDYFAEVRVQHNALDSPVRLPVFVVVSEHSDAGAITTAVPRSFALGEVFPNPFNAEAAVRFAVPRQEQVRLDLYDVTGRRVGSLLDARKPPGWYTFRFSAAGLPSGVYLIRMTAGEFTAIGRAVLLK